MSTKLRIAILGTGNIGTDLLIKVLRSPVLECRLFAGRNLSSPGMTKASQLGVAVSSAGLRAIENQATNLDLVFDATSAADHQVHAPILRRLNLIAVDLTPAKVGRMCVPAVNLEACLAEANVNMVSCGGQASIPLAWAIAQACPQVEYFETVSSIASRSAGPATRINLDEYLSTTEQGLQTFSGCPRTKAILVVNPAQPCVHMQTTVFARIAQPDLAAIRAQVAAVVQRLRTYIPGYHLLLEPVLENGRVAVIVRVDGRGDFLPKYAGNLDIINCAAVAVAEAHARRRQASIP
jgi:acetaldehyde dehydrogenase